MSHVIILLMVGLLNPLLTQCIYSGEQMSTKPPLHREAVIDKWFQNQKLSPNTNPKEEVQTTPANHDFSKIQVTTSTNEDIINHNLLSEDTDKNSFQPINEDINLIDDQVESLTILDKILKDFIKNQSETVISKNLMKSDDITNKSEENVSENVISVNYENNSFEEVLDKPLILRSELNLDESTEAQNSDVINYVNSEEISDKYSTTEKLEVASIINRFQNSPDHSQITFRDSSENDNTAVNFSDNNVDDKSEISPNFNSKNNDGLIVFPKDDSLEVNENIINEHENFTNKFAETSDTPDISLDPDNKSEYGSIAFPTEENFAEINLVSSIQYSNENIDFGYVNLTDLDQFNKESEVELISNEISYSVEQFFDANSTISSHLAHYQNNGSIIDGNEQNSTIRTSSELDIDHTLSNETDVRNESTEITDGREREKFREGKTLYERCDDVEYAISPHRRKDRRPCKKNEEEANVFSDENTEFSFNDERHIPIPTNVSRDIKLMNNTNDGKVTSPEEISCPVNHTGLVPIDSDCRTFINCWKGIPYVMTCGPGTLFNRRKNVCDHAHDVECPSGHLTKNTRPMKDDIENNIIEDSLDTKPILDNTNHASNLLSNNGSILQGERSARMLGTARQARYFPPYQAESDLQNIDKEVYIGDECPPGATGQFVYAYDCRQFLNCWNGRGYIQPCALGTLFNPETLECDHANKVDCLHRDFSSSGSGGNRQGQLAATRSSIWNTNAEPKCEPGAAGVFPHPSDCSKFLNCANGMTYIQQCGPGTAFNPLFSVCDYPHNVGCDIPQQQGPGADYESVRADPSPPMRYHVSDRRPGRPGKNLVFGSQNPQFISSNRLDVDNRRFGAGGIPHIIPPTPVTGFNPNQYDHQHGNPNNLYDRQRPHSQIVPPPPVHQHHDHQGGMHNPYGAGSPHNQHRGNQRPSTHHQHGEQPQYNIRGHHRPAINDHRDHPPHHDVGVEQSTGDDDQDRYGGRPSHNVNTDQQHRQGGIQHRDDRTGHRPSHHNSGNQRPTVVGNPNRYGGHPTLNIDIGHPQHQGGNQHHDDRLGHRPDHDSGFHHGSSPSDPYLPAESNVHHHQQRPGGQNIHDIRPENPSVQIPSSDRRDQDNRKYIHRQNTTTGPRREFGTQQNTTNAPHYIHTVRPKINIQGYRQNSSHGFQNRPESYDLNVPVYGRGDTKTPVRKAPSQTYNPWQPSSSVPARPRIGAPDRDGIPSNRANTIDCIPRPHNVSKGSRPSAQPGSRYDGYYNPKPSQSASSNRENREPVYCDEPNIETTRYGSTQSSARYPTSAVGPVPTRPTSSQSYGGYARTTTPMTPEVLYAPTPILVVVTPPTQSWYTTASPLVAPPPVTAKSSNIMRIPPRNAKSNPLRPEITETMGKIIQMMYFGNKQNVTTPSTLEVLEQFGDVELIKDNRQNKKTKTRTPLGVIPLNHHRPGFIERSPSDCADGHFKCDDSKCITLSKICNKVQDCDDGTDEEQCEERIGYDIRLANSDKSNEGRVEVKAFGVWGSVCDDKFGLRDADVICKELGFKLGAAQAEFHMIRNETEPVVFLMDDLECLGNETSIRECQFNGWGVHDCLPEEAAGVVCRTPAVKCPQDFWLCATKDECIPTSFLCDNVPDCADGSDESDNICNQDIELRLANGPNKLEGRVEVKFRGIWGTVCDDDFTDKAAQVVCRMLGFEGPAKAKKEGAYGPGTGQIWLDQVACFGNETNIAQCMHWQWGENNCGHSEDVGVVCSNTTLRTENRGRGLSLDESTVDFVDDNYLQTGDSAELLPSECGVRIRNEGDDADDDGVAFRVVRGSLAKIGDYPWQASLRVRGPAQSAHWCGAVLISKLHLLTAAHCLVAFSKGAYFIRVGDHDAVEMEVYIEEFYVHEDFRKGQHMNNDIAVIKLKPDGVPLGKWIRPICLPPKEVEYTPGKNCTISGWGSIQTGKSSPSNQLRAGWVPIQPMDVCKMPQVYGDAITEGMICAGELDEGVDACDGDSGGPLACLHDGVYTLFGITSWGQHCGHANKPGVYVRVAHYRDWIDDKIKLSMTEK